MAQKIKILYCEDHDHPRIEEFTNFIKRRMLRSEEKNVCGHTVFRNSEQRLKGHRCMKRATVEFTYLRIRQHGKQITFDPEDYTDL